MSFGMFNLFQAKFVKREVYFHEDDYCQQELLPREALRFAEAEVKKIGEFADAHRDPDGAEWTEVYVRPKLPVNFRALGMTKEDIHAVISAHLLPFDIVCTGYSSYRERCRNTAAWGTSARNALFAEWDQEGVVTSVWSQFFESDEKSLTTASKAMIAIGMVHSLIYVDWAWGYTCELVNGDAFAGLLRTKLEGIAKNSGQITND
jgi:hypothetical protein